MSSLPNSLNVVSESKLPTVLGDMCADAESHLLSPSSDSVKTIQVGMHFIPYKSAMDTEFAKLENGFTQWKAAMDKEFADIENELSHEIDRIESRKKRLHSISNWKLEDVVEVLSSDEEQLEEDLEYELEKGRKQRCTLANLNPENVIDLDGSGDEGGDPAVLDAGASTVPSNKIPRISVQKRNRVILVRQETDDGGSP